MKNDFLVMCRYKGSEEYQPKDKENTIVLHEFLDTFGNSFKISIPNFKGEVDKDYIISIRLGDTRKDGVYRKYWSVTPVDPNDIKLQEV